MPDIKDSVGEGTAKNNPYDVALVQAMLRVIKNAKSAPYLSSNYDGSYGNNTKNAIIAFQTDNNLAAEKAAAGGGGGAAAPALDKVGVIAKDGPTFKKMVESLPADYKNITIIENTKTVYLTSSVDSKDSEKAISTNNDLEVNFRGKVTTLVQQMYEKHKIVLWVTPSGTRRTFAQQAALKAESTKAGPGESNHNFGRAVDIGFKGLQWVQGDGTIKTDDYWLNTMYNTYKPKNAKFDAFWNARDAIATGLTLFHLNFERIHLQSYNQDTVSVARSLAALLNGIAKEHELKEMMGKIPAPLDALVKVAGKNKMQWQAQPGKPNQYKSDLGLGGTLFTIGTAKQIWASQATVTKANIAQARTDAIKSALMKLGAAGQKALKDFKAIKEADIKAEEVTKIQKLLKGDFELADNNWSKWQPLP